MINLVGCSVKVGNLDLLKFFFPNFIITDKVPLTNKTGIIFIGELRNIAKIRDRNIPFILAKGVPEFDLTNRSFLLEYVYSKFNRVPPKYLTKSVDDMEEQTFFNNVKLFWVSGKWNKKDDVDYKSLFELYRAFNRGSISIMKVYFALLKDSNISYIQRMVINFLSKAQSNLDIRASAGFLSDLKSFKLNKGERINNCIRYYLSLPIDNEELKFMIFLIALSK